MKTPEIQIATRRSEYGSARPTVIATWTGIHPAAAAACGRAAKADLYRMAAQIEEASISHAWIVQVGDIENMGRGTIRGTIAIELSSGTDAEGELADRMLHDVIPSHLTR